MLLDNEDTKLYNQYAEHVINKNVFTLTYEEEYPMMPPFEFHLPNNKDNKVIQFLQIPGIHYFGRCRHDINFAPFAFIGTPEQYIKTKLLIKKFLINYYETLDWIYSLDYKTRFYKRCFANINYLLLQLEPHICHVIKLVKKNLIIHSLVRGFYYIRYDSCPDNNYEKIILEDVSAKKFLMKNGKIISTITHNMANNSYWGTNYEDFMENHYKWELEFVESDSELDLDIITRNQSIMVDHGYQYNNKIDYGAVQLIMVLKYFKIKMPRPLINVIWQLI